MGAYLEVPKEINFNDLEHKVKAMYRQVALHPDGEFHFEMGRSLAERLGYPSYVLDWIPADATQSFAGVGYHFDLANIKQGDCVLDLGSGSGMDAFFAALQTGDKGEVIGIDMTPEQLFKAENLRKKGSFSNVIFLQSNIEQLPIIHGSIDVVVSNGVINVSVEKETVFKEAARALKRGGRLAISDIVTETPLSKSITCDVDLWASRIGGAMLLPDYCALIESVGFSIKQVLNNPEYHFISKSAVEASKACGIKSISLLAEKQ